MSSPTTTERKRGITSTNEGENATTGDRSEGGGRSETGEHSEAGERSDAAEGDDAADAAPRDRGPLSRDLVFDALKNSRRRQVLRYLDEHDGETRIGDLAEHVAAIENDTTTAALDSAQRKRVYVGLYQCHLPRLDDMGIIEFDQPRGHVEVGPAAPQLEKYLDVDEDDDRPWYSYHLAVTTISALAVLVGMATGLVGTAGGALLVVMGTSLAFLIAVRALDRLH